MPTNDTKVTYNSSGSGALEFNKYKLAELVKAPNVAEMLTKQELECIGETVVSDYRKDLQSREPWEERNEQAIKLALQVVEQKSFPWTNCSNVKFPLLTIAALQFLARISVLSKGRHLVRMEVVGSDQDGSKFQQAQRISTHMSFQLTDEDISWVDDDEKTKLSTAILGSGFKKSYYDHVQGINISEFVPAMNFVVDYYCKNIDKANRATHLLSMSRNKIQERVRRGIFCKMDANTDGPESPEADNLLAQASDEAAGLVAPATPDEYAVLEQHRWWDLDGDGYEEPYIMFVREDTKQVLRIVARFFDAGDVYRVNDGAVTELQKQMAVFEQAMMPQGKDKPAPSEDEIQSLMRQQSALEKQIQLLETSKDNYIVRIDPVKCFTKYTFIPSPDGGFYGLGLGALLGPMNESVNTLVNQLIDGGTMSNSAGGFIGRGVKLKAGKTTFDPFEWKPVDSTGDDLRKGLFPLPVREPSGVLFQLLGMLVTYSEKISGATDIMTGISPGQNTPAETSRNTVEQGMMLFSGIYARMYRSFREELRKLYELNRLYLKSSPKFAALVDGPSSILANTDYESNRFRIFPSADASTVSTTQRKEKAVTIWQLASTTPGFNKYYAMKQLLESMEVENIDELYPDPQGPKAIQPQLNPKVELEKAKQALAEQEHKDEMQLAIMELQSDMAIGEARILELQAKAAKEMAEAKGVDTGHQIALLNAQMAAAKLRQDGMSQALAALQKAQVLKLQSDKQEHERGIAQKQQKAGPIEVPVLGT